MDVSWARLLTKSVHLMCLVCGTIALADCGNHSAAAGQRVAAPKPQSAAGTHVVADGVDAADPAAANDKLARREGVHGGQALGGDVPLHAPVTVAHVHDGVLADHGARLWLQG